MRGEKVKLGRAGDVRAVEGVGFELRMDGWRRGLVR